MHSALRTQQTNLERPRPTRTQTNLSADTPNSMYIINKLINEIDLIYYKHTQIEDLLSLAELGQVRAQNLRNNPQNDAHSVFTNLKHVYLRSTISDLAKFT